MRACEKQTVNKTWGKGGEGRGKKKTVKLKLGTLVKIIGGMLQTGPVLGSDSIGSENALFGGE